MVSMRLSLAVDLLPATGKAVQFQSKDWTMDKRNLNRNLGMCQIVKMMGILAALA